MPVYLKDGLVLLHSGLVAFAEACCCSGACCLSDGTCEFVSESQCSTDGGTWQGTGTNCSTTGACCIGSTCVTTTSSCCTGVYLGDGTLCSPNPCPVGACCYGGICTITTSTSCFGSYQGDGTTCSPNPCAGSTGACCHPNTTCSNTTPAGCNGHYLGGTCPTDHTCDCIRINESDWGSVCLYENIFNPLCADIGCFQCCMQHNVFHRCEPTNCTSCDMIVACAVSGFPCRNLSIRDCWAAGGSWNCNVTHC